MSHSSGWHNHVSSEIWSHSTLKGGDVCMRCACFALVWSQEAPMCNIMNDLSTLWFRNIMNDPRGGAFGRTLCCCLNTMTESTVYRTKSCPGPLTSSVGGEKGGRCLRGWFRRLTLTFWRFDPRQRRFAACRLGQMNHGRSQFGVRSQAAKDWCYNRCLRGVFCSQRLSPHGGSVVVVFRTHWDQASFRKRIKSALWRQLVLTLENSTLPVAVDGGTGWLQPRRSPMMSQN